ncbi:MAG: hypothetical protein OXE45_03295, partial [bacterium]|nr:hypothetical protein [bacterium]
MHTVRVHLNRGEGTTWWGESDNGFNGGAETLQELLELINGWAEFAGSNPEEIEVQLLRDEVAEAVRCGILSPPPQSYGEAEEAMSVSVRASFPSQHL